MIKRIIFIIILSLFLTGCKVEYKIDLDSQLNIKENIKLISTSETDKENFDEFSWYVPVDKNTPYGSMLQKFDDIKYYDQAKYEDKIYFEYKYKNDNYEEYTNSNLVNRAYEYISISKLDEDTVILSTSKEFLLFDRYDNLEEVKVTINTNYKVLSNNADEINNHNYTWIITEDNAYGKGIYLKIDTSKEDLTFMEKLKRGDYLNVFTISLLLAIIGLLIYIILKKYSEKRNEI